MTGVTTAAWSVAFCTCSDLACATARRIAATCPSGTLKPSLVGIKMLPIAQHGRSRNNKCLAKAGDDVRLCVG